MTDMTAQLHLGASTWTELDADQPPILLVPIGSCEQHGPHLPLDTDARIAVAIADRVASAGAGWLVTPPLAITASGEHQGFPGTLSIGVAATELVLIEFVRSADWAAGVVFVNGHGGNALAVANAVSVLSGEGRRVLAWWPRITGSDAHAGRTETSLLLAIAPALVRIEHAAAGNIAPLADLLDSIRAGGVASVSPNGVVGDPTSASAAEGERVLDALVADAIERIATWTWT